MIGNFAAARYAGQGSATEFVCEDTTLKHPVSIPEHIGALIATELQAAQESSDVMLRKTAIAFAACQRPPREVTVNFSGGLTQLCWSVARADGDYRLVYMPKAGYFSLCVESDFGPLDIGVHGSALGCFGSV